MKTQFYLIVVIISLLLSCKKDNSTPSGAGTGTVNDPNSTNSTSSNVTNNNLSIKFNAPLENSEFRNGDKISVKAAISHTKQLHEYTLYIKQNEKVLFQFSKNLNVNNATVDTSWTNNSTQGNLIIRIEAADHYGEKNAKEVAVKSVI